MNPHSSLNLPLSAGASAFPHQSHEPTIVLDPAIRNWVLIPIMVIMVLVGIFRHFVTSLLGAGKKINTQVNLKDTREQNALSRSINLRRHHVHIPYASFKSRQSYLVQAFSQGNFLAKPPQQNTTGQPEFGTPPDPANMEVMMDGMKKNMMMIIPQTVIMGWINFFFSGFLLIRLPFPLTVRFKAMLQRGIETPDLDNSWVSSLSWYFLNLFGLGSIYGLILGGNNAAGSTRDMQAMATAGLATFSSTSSDQTGAAIPMPSAGGMGAAPGVPNQPQNMVKMFESEKEFLELVGEYEWTCQGVEERVIKKYKDLLKHSVKQ